MAKSGTNNIVVIIAAQDDSGAVLKQLEQNLVGLKGRANEAGDAILRIAGKAVGIATLAALAVKAASALGATVTNALDLGTELENMSKKTGLSVGTLSTLRYAAKLTGNDFEQVSRAVARLDKLIGDAASGNKQAGAVLNSLGLNAKQLAGNTNGAEIAFQALGKQLANTSGPNQQALAMHAMGRSGADLIPILIQVGSNWDYLRQKAVEAGLQLDGNTAAQLAHSNRMLADMKSRVEGAGVAFTRGLTPGINSLLNVISDGKGNMDALVTFGHLVGRSMAVAEAAAYGLASGLYSLAAAGSIIGEDKMDQGLLDKAAEYNKKAQEARDFALTGKDQNPAPADPLDKPTKTGRGHGIIDVESAGKMESAVKQRDGALTRLAEEHAQLEYQVAKNSSEQMLAQLESEHKRELVTDEDFYSRKLHIQRAALDAERKEAVGKQAAVDKNIGELQKNARKHGGRFDVDLTAGTITVPKGKGGDPTAIEDEAKIADLLAKRLELTAQIAKVATDAAKLEFEYASDTDKLETKRLAISDDLAVKREEAAGSSISARLKQGADKYKDERDPLHVRLNAATKSGDATKITGAQNDLNNADANFVRDQDSIRVKGAEEQYGLAGTQINAQRSAVTDAAARGDVSTLDAQREKIALDKEEADNLQKLQAAYQRLANDGDLQATQKVVELGAQIRELRTPVDEAAAHMREQFDGAFQGLFENLDRGKKEWQAFGKEIERIFLNEAYRQFVEPQIQRGLGQVFKNGGGGVPFAGGDIRGGSAESAPGIGRALSSVVPGFGSLPGPLGLGGGGKGGNSGGTSLKVEIINQSGQPLAATSANQKSLQGELHDSVISIVLNSASTGGVLSHLFGG